MSTQNPNSTVFCRSRIRNETSTMTDSQFGPLVPQYDALPFYSPRLQGMLAIGTFVRSKEGVFRVISVTKDVQNAFWGVVTNPNG